MTEPDRRPQPGLCQWLAPDLRCVLAPNPSPMTHWGTNSFILGEGDVALIDPGPDDPAHRHALLAALRPGERISHIFVSHAHLDHSPLARPLANQTGAKVYAFGPASHGRSALMIRLAQENGLGGSEGVDHAFHPDIRLFDGGEVAAPSWHLRAIHTPGHFASHLCFGWQDRLFTGDHVMGWASSLVSPPDGDMGDYMASLAKLGTEPCRIAYPAHGAPIDDLATRIAALTKHRRDREAQILAALQDGTADIPRLAQVVYNDVTPALRPAAMRNLFAHLIDLTERKQVSAVPDLSFSARFSRI